MEAALTGPRKAFCTALGAIVPTGTFPAAATTTSVTNTDENMGIYDVTLNGTTITSLSSLHDGGYLNRVSSQPTIALDFSTSYTITVQVGVGNTFDDELAGVYVDFNQNGIFTDTGEELGVAAPGTGKKNGDTHSFTFITPASGAAPSATRLRMRIITDFDDAVTALTGATSPSQGGQIEDYSITLSVMLPVDLISFDAQLEQNKTVKVTWSTASEINSSHFEVERSVDGQRFSKIKTVNSIGNSTIDQSYKIIDDAPIKGLNYYRLKQIDVDGSFEHSEIKVVNIGGSSAVIELYPNPARNILYINGMNESNFQVNVYNQLGSLVKTINKSNNEVDINAFPNGVYYFQIVSTQINQVEKIVINR